MKKFLHKVLLYGLVVVALSLVTVMAVNNVQLKTYWKHRPPVEKAALAVQQDIQSLVLGSSHFYFGINSAIVAHNCFNASSVGQSLYEDYYILKSIAAEHQLNFMLLPVSYLSNHYYLYDKQEQGELLRVFDYKQAYDIKYPTSFKYLKSVFYFNSRLFKQFFDKPEAYTSSFDKWGNLSDTCVVQHHDISDSVATFNDHNTNVDFSRRNPYIDSILTYSKQHAIKVILVAPPVTAGYNNQIKNHDYDDLLSELAESYQLIDCRKLFTSNEDIYFKDADHLSACGRDSLSRYIHNVIATE